WARAVEVAVGVLVVHEESVGGEKDKKDKGKKGAPAEVVEEKKDPDADLPQQYHKTIETEDVLLRRRIDRIRHHACDQLRDLRHTSLTSYTLLEDCISLRFQTEMDAIRELMIVIKEAIEQETRLPNYLVLEGEKFRVNFRVLTFEPELEGRPGSPVEKGAPDQFTVLQLLNLALQFRSIAPDGTITSKDFVDCLHKMGTMSAGTELLPETYMNADVLQLQQLCVPLDPYETGFVNWRKFLMLNARILPAPTAEVVRGLRDGVRDVESFRDWTISKKDYESLSIWFEEDADDFLGGGGEETGKERFNRGAKLKTAIF
ncbi:Sperm flagellar protein 2, partial [Rhizophlyctis rosea]